MTKLRIELDVVSKFETAHDIGDDDITDSGLLVEDEETQSSLYAHGWKGVIDVSDAESMQLHLLSGICTNLASIARVLLKIEAKLPAPPAP